MIALFSRAIQEIVERLLTLNDDFIYITSDMNTDFVRNE